MEVTSQHVNAEVDVSNSAIIRETARRPLPKDRSSTPAIVKEEVGKLTAAQVGTLL